MMSNLMIMIKYDDDDDDGDDDDLSFQRIKIVQHLNLM